MSIVMLKPPLILTLSIDQKTFLFFNTLRKNHFPPDRNFIDAHLTLFHALPNENTIINEVRNLSNYQEKFEITIKEVVSIGKGVAFKVESDTLALLHKNLQNKWHSFLSPQDKQKIWPHITVQNKVTPEQAQKLLHELRNDLTPFSTPATGLQLFEYLNGPWKLIESFTFREAL